MKVHYDNLNSNYSNQTLSAFLFCLVKDNTIKNAKRWNKAGVQRILPEGLHGFLQITGLQVTKQNTQLINISLTLSAK